MNSTAATLVVGPTPVARAPGRHFRRDVLGLVVFCAVPVAGLLAAGRLTLAANVFWVLLALVVVGLIALGRHQMLLSLLLGTLPLVNLLRGFGFAFYNVILVLLTIGLAFYFYRAPGTWRKIWRQNPLMVWLCGLAGLYYLVSVVNTGDYSRNLRLSELTLAVVCVLLAGRRRHVLGTGLLGVVVSACAIGIGMLPHNDSVGRLGMIVIEDSVIGNPVQLGTALALAILVLTVDRGEWLNWPRSAIWRTLLFIPIAALLALTTSRAAWLIVFMGLLLTLLLGRGQRLRMCLAVGGGLLLLFGALQTRFGAGLQSGLNRTFSGERSLANRTSGRSDQWAVAYHAATVSWDRIVWGYGPGRGAAVYAYYSQRVEGVHYGVGREVVLHSLFMQVMVEAGLLGLLALSIFLLAALWRVCLWTWRASWLLPLVGCCGYLIAIVTVSGNDTMSGILLGLGLLAAAKS